MRVYIPKSQRERANNGALAFRNYFYEPLLPLFKKMIFGIGFGGGKNHFFE